MASELHDLPACWLIARIQRDDAGKKVNSGGVPRFFGRS